MSFRDRRMPRGIDLHVNGAYRVRVSYEGRQFTVGYFDTLGDAQAALAIARGQIARQIFVPPAERRRRRKAAEAAEEARQLTVRQWSATWLDQLARLGRSPGTTRSYSSTLNAHVLEAIGDKRLTDVTADDITAIARKATPSVARNIVRTLSAMFNAAIQADAGALTVSPVPAVELPRTRRVHGDESGFATLEEIKLIADAMPQQLRAAVWLAALCGLRQGEVLGLQRRDLDLTEEDAWVHIRRQWLSKAQPPTYAPPKSGSEGVVAIPEQLAVMLRDHLKRSVAAEPDSPVFVGRTPGRPISQGAFDRAWREAREPVRPGLHFHALRHVALTLFAQQGATGRETQARGRHTSAEVALRYQESTRARDRALTDQLDEALKPLSLSGGNVLA